MCGGGGGGGGGVWVRMCVVSGEFDVALMFCLRVVFRLISLWWLLGLPREG